jgi:hypothetical protein
MTSGQAFRRLLLVWGLVTLWLAIPAFGSAPTLTLSPSNPVLIKGVTINFQALLGTENKNSDVKSWTSSNPAVATIDSTGHAVALAAGTTTITAAVNKNLSGSTNLVVITVSNPIFSLQPSATPVSAAISPAVKVLIQDNRGLPIAGLTLTMSIGTNGGQGGTGVLGGTLSHVTDSTGTTTFADLKIDWVGSGYTLVATVATPTGPLSSTSAPFDETRVGDMCLGPNPSCSSGCPDADNDGLNDAWEIAGGIDLNGDGKITDSYHDLLLPGADPNRPDVYLKYDYMVYTSTTPNPAGDGPHSHQPSEAAIQQVVEAFAAHGITLHIDPQHDAIPEVFVTTRDPNPTVACAANGISGGGYNFVSMKTLREKYFGNRKWAYHYAVWAHSAVVPDTAPDCSTRANSCFACPTDPECGGHPDPTSSGNADVFGSNLIVALGTFSDNTGIPPESIGVETQASIFMHELGHNFGLKHGSLAAPAPQTCLSFKPNYMSVMDFLNYANGIGTAAVPGSTKRINCNTDADCPAGNHCTNDLGGSLGGNVCYRIDYSSEKLLTLNEASLNETLGVGGAPSDTDIVTYCAMVVACTLHGPTFGPIDWNNDGAIETSAQGDIDNDNGLANTTLQTGNDWEMVGGFFTNLNFKFQCAPGFAQGAAGASSDAAPGVSCLGLRDARERHILYPPANVSISIRPGCSQSRKPIAPNEIGTVTVALLGSDNLDVIQVEPSSLNFHGAQPKRTSIRDVNGDGKRDLVAEFETRGLHLHPDAKTATLTGWLKNSRAFSASAEIVVVPSMALVDSSCR